jgi:putative peptidoglycan lipid II flippase
MNGATTEQGSGRGLVRGFADIGAGTLVSRLSGFAREVVTAAFFGAGTGMDIFVAAFTIPNLFCRVLGESSVEAGFMPLFKGTHSRGETDRAWRLASRMTNWLTLVLIGVVLAGIAAAPFLVSVVAHGFKGDVAQATVRMTRLMFPFGLAIGLAALMGAILLAFGRFRVYSLAPVLLNVGIVGSVLALSGRLSYVSLGVGVLVGGFLQFLVQVPFVQRLARRDGQSLFTKGLGYRDGDVRQAVSLTGPVIAASVIQRVGVIVDRTIASFLVPGSISALYYSFRLVHLPYAILALAAGRSAAPVLAEQYAAHDWSGFARTLTSGLRMNLVFLTPVVVLSVLLARPVVGIIYQRGAFDATDLGMTASAFALYAVGLVGMGLEFLLVRAFAARLDTRTPVRVAILAFFLNVVLNLLLVRTPLRHAGLALATSISFTVHAAILYTILNRELAGDGVPVVARQLLAASGKVVAASAALVLVFWPLDSWLGMRFAEQIMLGRVLRVFLAGGAGAAAYLLVSAALGLSEVKELFVRGRRGRPQ